MSAFPMTFGYIVIGIVIVKLCIIQDIWIYLQ